MKKKVFSLLIPLLILGLTGCVKYNGQEKSSKKSNNTPSSEVAPQSEAQQQTSDNEQLSSVEQQSSVDNNSSSSAGENNEGNLPAGTDVKVYLAFGEYGKYQGNLVSNKIPSLYLEHTVELSAKVGDDLPGKADVTSTVSGSEFVAWVAYNNDGKLTEYTKVPGVDNKILYASFSGGEGGAYQGGSTPTPPPTPVEDVTYTVTNLPTWIKDNDCVIFAWVWSASDSGSWKSLAYGNNSDASFTVKGELTGFLLARCIAGTTQPSWTVTGNNAGRVYNQTENISCVSGTYSYACAEWKEYNPA